MPVSRTTCTRCRPSRLATPTTITNWITEERMPDAVVIGAGPNGLVGANLLADRGWKVTVLEAASTPGGAVRSAELMEAGFVNDIFSAFYPFAMASPAIKCLNLEQFGLR